MTPRHDARPAGDCDVLIAADFTLPGDRAYRLAQEARVLHGRGLRVGLLQYRQPAEAAVISPEVQTCVRRGFALVLDPALPCRASQLIVHEPSRADAGLPALAHPQAAHVTHVCHGAADFTPDPTLGTLTAPGFRALPVSPFLRATATAPGRDACWLPLLPPESSSRPLRNGALAVGWYGDLAIGDLADSLPEAEHFQLKDGAAGQGGRAVSALSPDRLVAQLDVVVLSEAEADLPDTLIALALAAGMPVVLPRRLKPHYGKGPLYAAAGKLRPAVRQALRAARSDRPAPPPAEFVTRCRAQAADLPASAPAPFAAPLAPRPTLCLAANGVGVGHLTRLLAIARRMEGEVVFASQVPALEILDAYGYQAEYIPSAATVGGDFAAWDAWFGAHLTRILDRYDPACVVYDGNHPSWGLIEAVGSRRDCALAWVRRGMWANTTSAHLANARWCDLVIEPGELAGARDHGVTAGLRHEALQIDPIRLLEEDELFDRAAAASRLGLDPRRPAVLIQLGSGHNRDLLSLLDQIITLLGRTPGLQIALAEWVNGTIPLTLWPQVKVLRGFPLSQYLRAFDFCISAAGYNSFHELIGFSVPTIFIANRHPTMDDQYARAKFAQDSAAAFEISEQDLHDLPDLIALLTQDRPRDFLASHCRKLTRDNGAFAAAEHLQTLAQSGARALP